MYKIEFVELDNKAPFEEFIAILQKHEVAKIFASIDKFVELKNANLPIGENLSKKLDDGIFEIRVSLPNKIVRNLYPSFRTKKYIFTTEV